MSNLLKSPVTWITVGTGALLFFGYRKANAMGGAAQDITVKGINDVSVSNIATDKTTMKIKLVVKNPSSQSVTINGVTGEVVRNNEVLANFQDNTKRTIGPGETIIPLSVKITNSSFLQSVSNYITDGAGSLGSITINGNVKAYNMQFGFNKQVNLDEALNLSMGDDDVENDPSNETTDKNSGSNESQVLEPIGPDEVNRDDLILDDSEYDYDIG